jgi:hypothetical protein
MAASGMLLAACGSEEEASVGLPDDATVTYAFADASVPPQYHRSVVLTVTREDTRIVVDSYGEVLADEQVTTPSSVWTTLGSTLPTVSDLTTADPGQGCTGGTAIRLTVASPAGTLLDLDPQFCGGANDDLEDPIDAWIAPARDLFPATDVLAPEGE